VAEARQEIPQTEEVHNCDLAEIWHDGLQVHDYTYDDKSEEVE
jgi:hypothetical protein